MKISNTKTGKTSGICRAAAIVSTDGKGQEDVELPFETNNMHWLENGDNECLANSNNGDDTDDGVVNDEDTSTSFSLQECMNEFRARRIRRTSLSHHRQDIGKDGGISSRNFQENTELDLINQNLCNKEQERKCKPCQNGFCYCFTSDSGDGGINLGNSNTIRGKSIRITKRNKRAEYKQFTSPKPKENCKDLSQNPKSPKKISTNKLKATTSTTNQLTAISSLETSPIDAPLIHIIQELRGNCVISKVKVNKHKIQANQKLMQKNFQFKNEMKSTNSNHKSSFNKTMPDLYKPTAPMLEKFEEFENSETTEKDLKSSHLKNSKKCTECSERRRSGGGVLLQKRLSSSQFSYKPRNTKEAPPKPPRSTRNSEDQCCESSESTSPSVREAERVLDDFLKKKGFKEKGNTTCIKEKIIPPRTFYSNKRKSYPLTPKDIKLQTESLYPKLRDIKKVVESKKSPIYGKNIQIPENEPKVMSMGWNDAKINDMLNCDANSKHKKFHSTATQAQPQQRPSSDEIGNVNNIGWQIPPKVSLDTVDGFVGHNLASNVDDKNTPVKSKIAFPNKQTKDASRKFPWSEQFRHLSPWSNKNSMNDVNDSKSNMLHNSKSLIKLSKKKFLRLVSPKKDNREQKNIQITKTPYRTIGVQTSCVNSFQRQDNIHGSFEHSSNHQSPPGSYHSPIQSSTQSQNTTPNTTEPAVTHFNFSRIVNSPPKKAPRSSQRKLNFPLNCTLISNDDARDLCTRPTHSLNDKKTYHSFNTELDHDVSLSKISYILSNIRAKLEANDEQAMRTFLETDRVTDNRSIGFDCPDSNHSIVIGESCKLQEHNREEDNFNDPIYSEIEDESVHISESPHFENHTGIQHYISSNNPEILYAKINKNNKKISERSNLMETKAQIPLAKIIQDSLKNKKIITNVTLLPPLPEPPESEISSNSTPMPLLQSQSLNNVRVMEHNSQPKTQRILSKSDLSLHRSEIFLENLCKSELILNADTENENLEKVQNVPNRSYVSMTQPSPNDLISNSSQNDHELTLNDTVSYELPPNNYDDVDGFADSIDTDNSTTAGSNLGLNAIVPPSSHNQSTPKKQSFTTKDKLRELNVDVDPNTMNDHLCNSFPIAPNKHNDQIDRMPIHSHSMNEVDVDEYASVKNPNISTVNTLTRYKSLKNVLQKSFRKSKTFIKTEGKRLSNSFNLSANNAIGISSLYRDKQSYIDSNLNLDSLFSLNESASINEQLVKTVSICRKLPDLEISTEMVEAERLLLFSALRRENQEAQSSICKKNQTMNQKPKMRFFIDEMYLPIVSDGNRDIFFNYFYIVTFECGGIIKSTQSVECLNGTAVFRDCGIEFTVTNETESSNNGNYIRCNIFMLRLRKISTATFEPRKRTVVETFTQGTSSTLQSSSSSLSSSNEVVSRFRLHASFTLNATNFVPYEYVHQESTNSDRICIRSSCFCKISLVHQIKSSNLAGEMQLKGRAEVRYPKRSFEGFLNVEDPHAQHNWNRRWCTLDGIFLYVWQDENVLNESPLMILDLRDTKRNMNSPLTCSPRELCARPRSFCLECTIRKECEDVSTATIFFAAETQDNLDDWLKNLNIALDFILKWL